jgi:hypothetical protein
MVLAAGRDLESGRYQTKDEYSGRILSKQMRHHFSLWGEIILHVSSKAKLQKTHNPEDDYECFLGV